MRKSKIWQYQTRDGEMQKKVKGDERGDCVCVCRVVCVGWIYVIWMKWFATKVWRISNAELIIVFRPLPEPHSRSIMPTKSAQKNVIFALCQWVTHGVRSRRRFSLLAWVWRQLPKPQIAALGGSNFTPFNPPITSQINRNPAPKLKFRAPRQELTTMCTKTHKGQSIRILRLN